MSTSNLGNVHILAEIPGAFAGLSEPHVYGLDKGARRGKTSVGHGYT
jgi:hypothetical protein